MPKQETRSAAQINAQNRYDEKRKCADRLPSTRLRDEQSALMSELYSLFDSKVDAIITATEYYLKNHKK